MAIYTKLDKEKVVSIISNYNLGNMNNYQGIKEGIENTNYLVETDKGKFILTIYEKRVNKDDIPFFLELMNESKFAAIAASFTLFISIWDESIPKAIFSAIEASARKIL